jgi:hypothetical protein
MYCERCGNQTDDSLNYCNACGASLRHEAPRSLKSYVAFLVAGLTATVLVGLTVFAGLLILLLDKFNRPEPAFVFGAFYLLVLFGICFLIMRQVSKLIDAELRTPKESRKAGPNSSPPLVQLPARSTNQLDEFREPASVTDETTRTLDEVRINRR